MSIRTIWRRLTGAPRPQTDEPEDVRAGDSAWEKNDLDEKLQAITALVGNPADLQSRRFFFGEKRQYEAAVMYFEELVDSVKLTDVITGLTNPVFPEKLRSTEGGSSLVTEVRDSLLTVGGIQNPDGMADALHNLLSGSILLLIDNAPGGLAIEAHGWAKRSADEPVLEPTIRGPHEGFVEDLRSSLSMVARRIPDPKLRIEIMYLGRRTRTRTALMYMDDIASKDLVTEVRTRLKRVQMDAVLDGGYIQELMEDHPLSVFPQIEYTERPDNATISLLSGRVAVMLDGSPTVMLVPATFPMLALRAVDDYYHGLWLASLTRIVRQIGWLIALFLPSLYVALTTVNTDFLPYKLAVTIASTRVKTPFSAIFEVLFMEGTMELLREASLRLPKTIGSTVTIVGGLVIGQAAVQANLISPLMIIVVTGTAIASFSAPHYEASSSARILRFILIFAAAILGIFGTTLTGLAIFIYAYNMKSFGVPYMTPLSPLMPEEITRTVIRGPRSLHPERPEYWDPQNELRQPSGGGSKG